MPIARRHHAALKKESNLTWHAAFTVELRQFVSSGLWCEVTHALSGRLELGFCRLFNVVHRGSVVWLAFLFAAGTVNVTAPARALLEDSQGQRQISTCLNVLRGVIFTLTKNRKTAQPLPQHSSIFLTKIASDPPSIISIIINSSNSALYPHSCRRG